MIRLCVLHVISSLAPARGGTTSSVLNLIEALRAENIACETASCDDELAPDAAIRCDPANHLFSRKSVFYTFAPSFGSWLRKHVCRYDLVHVHGLFSYFPIAGSRIARAAGVPVIVTPHGMVNHYGMRHKPLMKKISFCLFERSVLKGATVVHLTSGRETRDFGDLGLTVRTTEIPFAVTPIPAGNAESFFRRYPELRNKRIVAFMGRIDPIKNLESLIDALSLLAKRSDNVRLLICGSGTDDYRNVLKDRAERAGIGDRILWAGFVAGIERANALAAAHCFVLPSHSESFGMAAIEAVSAGIPCVLGKNVAVADDLVSAGFGVAVDPVGESLAAAIEQALTFADENFSVRAREYVERTYSATVIGAEFAALYREILRPPRTIW
ncbi:glycosyl transferase, group 1 family protein [Methylococcus capsulatus str. Bath]|uniref:Glycosyl transferase, group 1 family protein n=1 Tax=Methylococcus capsulatus (strain ATCC 33009 / NCIMB 11132 / Bath) TaxID=243233 RepID=Q609R8_METCA|nr:glycosyl transferase, group 1 family protein [Methylococcus capsulatus str. Bath]